MNALKKLEILKEYLKELGSAAIAFSGGTDSAFLLHTAQDVLGSNIIAITAQSRAIPRQELNDAIDFCKNKGIRHIIFTFDELAVDGFRANPPNRCYLCKKEFMSKILDISHENGIKFVADGSNIDDECDYRPGLQAAAELGIKSPLRAANLSKTEIRCLSKLADLPTWNKPASACLASRFAYGEEITAAKLNMVGSAEQFLLDMGFQQVRVRIHNNIARIEIIPDKFDLLLEHRIEIDEKLKSLGFAYVAVDLLGYRMGSMNETLKGIKNE